MEIKEKTVENIQCISLRGKVIGGPELMKLKSTLINSIDSKYPDIVIDFKDVTFMDSSGTGLIVSAHTQAEREGVSLCVSNLTKKVYELFIVIKLITIFTIYGTLEDAIAGILARRRGDYTELRRLAKSLPYRWKS